LTYKNGKTSHASNSIATLDIEASGIHADAYPIEIGVSLPNGDSWCSLIQPVHGWIHWNDQSEQIHGISREELFISGKTPLQVAKKLNSFLGESIAYSDCWVLDNPWLIKLYEQAGIKQTFSLLDMMHIMTEENYNCLVETKHKVALELDLQRHRATNDARVLRLAYEELLANRG